MTGYHTVDDSEWLTMGCQSPLEAYDSEPYQGRSFKSLITELYHHCNQGKSLIEVQGMPGSGTTTLLKSLMRSTSCKKNLYIMGKAGLTPRNLGKAITKQAYDLKPHSTQGSDWSIQLLKALKKSPHAIRVVIDEAQNLPQNTLNAIKQTCQIQPQASQIQFILAYQHSYQSSNQGLRLCNFTLEETKDFLKKLLPLPANESNYHQVSKTIYQETEGNIKQIIQKAPLYLKTLLLSQPDTQPSPAEPTTSYLKVYGRLAISATLGCVGMLMLAFALSLYSPSSSKKSVALQLAALPSQEQASQFIEKIPETLRSQVFSYQALRDGNPTTLVLMGPFTNQGALEATQKMLTQWSAKLKGWIRPMAHVHKEMNELPRW